MDWLSLGQSRTGQGDGTVSWAATANPIVNERRGAIAVNGTRVEIVQAAATCAFAIDRPSTAVGAAGGRHDVGVTAQAGCAWSARSDASWIVIISGSSGTGAGSVAVQVAANSSPDPRSGTLTIDGLTYVVDQAGVPPGNGGSPGPPVDPNCTFTVTPMSASFAAEGGVLEVSVAASAQGCVWTAQSAAPWIALEGGVAETGSGRRRFIIAANATNQARAGMVSVAGAAITITQTAGSPSPSVCTFTIAPTSTSVPTEGGVGEITVTASGGTCTWTAQSAVPWITIQSGANGTGSGRVSYTVAPNPGTAERSGTVAIGGLTFAVTQAAQAPRPCTYSVSPTATSVPAGGGSGEISVTASAATCSWSATVHDAWISLSTSGGMGTGRLSFTVAANSGPARVGSVTVAGQHVAITQPAGQSEEVTVEGKIAGLTGSCPNVTFALSGTTIITNAATQYRANEACVNLRNGRQAQVRGRVQSNGSVVAERIENISGGDLLRD
jgi:hypothetical protein